MAAETTTIFIPLTVKPTGSSVGPSELEVPFKPTLEQLCALAFENIAEKVTLNCQDGGVKVGASVGAAMEIRCHNSYREHYVVIGVSMPQDQLTEASCVKKGTTIEAHDILSVQIGDIVPPATERKPLNTRTDVWPSMLGEGVSDILNDKFVLTPESAVLVPYALEVKNSYDNRPAIKFLARESSQEKATAIKNAINNGSNKEILEALKINRYGDGLSETTTTYKKAMALLESVSGSRASSSFPYKK